MFEPLKVRLYVQEVSCEPSWTYTNAKCDMIITGACIPGPRDSGAQYNAQGPGGVVGQERHHRGLVRRDGRPGKHH